MIHRYESEYNPYSDENWGRTRWQGERIIWPTLFLKVYMAKLGKGWPAQMAAAAGRRAEKGEVRWQSQ